MHFVISKNRFSTFFLLNLHIYLTFELKKNQFKEHLYIHTILKRKEIRRKALNVAMTIPPVARSEIGVLILKEEVSNFVSLKLVSPLSCSFHDGEGCLSPEQNRRPAMTYAAEWNACCGITGVALSRSGRAVRRTCQEEPVRWSELAAPSGSVNDRNAHKLTPDECFSPLGIAARGASEVVPNAQNLCGIGHFQVFRVACSH